MSLGQLDKLYFANAQGKHTSFCANMEEEWIGRAEGRWRERVGREKGWIAEVEM